MASVVLEHVAKRYGDNPPVISDIDLEIREHEFVVLVGPSGCGKSTLLRMVAGLEEITSGTISIGGRVVNEVPPKDRDIAMVFQSYALYPHMSVRENLQFGLKIRGTAQPEIDRLVNESAKILGLEQLLDRHAADELHPRHRGRWRRRARGQRLQAARPRDRSRRARLPRGQGGDGRRAPRERARGQPADARRDRQAGADRRSG